MKKNISIVSGTLNRKDNVDRLIKNTIDKYDDYTIRKIADLLYVRHEDFIIAKHQ